MGSSSSLVCPPVGLLLLLGFLNKFGRQVGSCHIFIAIHTQFSNTSFILLISFFSNLHHHKKYYFFMQTCVMSVNEMSIYIFFLIANPLFTGNDACQ